MEKNASYLELMFFIAAGESFSVGPRFESSKKWMQPLPWRLTQADLPGLKLRNASIETVVNIIYQVPRKTFYLPVILQQQLTILGIFDLILRSNVEISYVAHLNIFSLLSLVLNISLMQKTQNRDLIKENGMQRRLWLFVIIYLKLCVTLAQLFWAVVYLLPE